MSPKLMHVVGARPNFVKLAPVIAALADDTKVEQLVVHTGQHYDARMSDDILADLQFPTPDVYLGIGSGTHAEQTGRTMIAFERVLLEERPDLVVVAGDVNATLACALTAAKAHIPVAHVESGLRSWDWTMPEEINRTITDRISALLFTHSPEARDNLVTEGIDEDRVYYVGNTMIDSLRRAEPFARRRAVWRGFGLEPHAYVLVTLHRPSNVDVADQLTGIVGALCELASRAPVVFPLHPRTAALLEATGQLDRVRDAGVCCCEPLGYIDFLSMELGAGAVLTDSGGVQEESTALGVRCYTLRPNTERPITLTLGTNTLLHDDPLAIRQVAPSGEPPVACTVPLWDGHAGGRIADLIRSRLARREDLEVAWSL